MQLSHAGRSSTVPIFEQSAAGPVPESVPPLDEPPLEDVVPLDPPLLEVPPSPPGTVDEPLLLDEEPSGPTKSSGGSEAQANAMPATASGTTA
jgi:hypothetical protein